MRRAPLLPLAWEGARRRSPMAVRAQRAAPSSRPRSPGVSGGRADDGGGARHVQLTERVPVSALIRTSRLWDTPPAPLPPSSAPPSPAARTRVVPTRASPSARPQPARRAPGSRRARVHAYKAPATWPAAAPLARAPGVRLRCEARLASCCRTPMSRARSRTWRPPPPWRPANCWLTGARRLAWPSRPSTTRSHGVVDVRACQGRAAGPAAELDVGGGGCQLGSVRPLLIEEDVPKREKTEVYDRTNPRGTSSDICDGRRDGVGRRGARVQPLDEKLGWMLFEGTNWKAGAKLIGIWPLMWREAGAEREQGHPQPDDRARSTTRRSSRRSACSGECCRRSSTGSTSRTRSGRRCRGTVSSTPRRRLGGRRRSTASRNWPLKLFVEVCNDEEMAEAVVPRPSAASPKSSCALGCSPRRAPTPASSFVSPWASPMATSSRWPPAGHQGRAAGRSSAAATTKTPERLTKRLFHPGSVDEKHDETHYEAPGG